MFTRESKTTLNACTDFDAEKEGKFETHLRDTLEDIAKISMCPECKFSTFNHEPTF